MVEIVKKNSLYVILIAFLCLPAVFSLLRPGFFQSDDGEWMVIRFSAFHQALRDGQFPVRLLARLNHGYGYPVANFLYPGFMYLSEPVHVLGFGFVDTIKIIFGLSMAGSALFFFLFLSKFFDRLSSFIGAVFYLYTPYHLFDLYIRGSIGEVLALMIIPFILWQTERRSIFWSTIGLAFLILSHNTLALLFIGFFMLYVGLDLFIAKEKRKLVAYYLPVLLLGFGIASFFWVPAFFDLHYTVFSMTPIANWKEYFSNIDNIGISTIFVLLLTIILFLGKKIRLSKHRLTALMFVVGIISLFFATSFSFILWNILPVSFIQFPFRLLSITLITTSFLVACITSLLTKRVRIVVSSFMLILLFLSSWSLLTPSQVFDKGESFYATNEASTTIANEYMPKWVKELPTEHPSNKVDMETGNGTITNLSYNAKKITFRVDTDTSSVVRVNAIYFPGFRAFINGGESTINYNNRKGLMHINLTKGSNNVKVEFEETSLHLAADIMSLLSLFFLLYLIRKQNIWRGRKS